VQAPGRRPNGKRRLATTGFVLAFVALGAWVYSDRGNSTIHNGSPAAHGSVIAAPANPPRATASGGVNEREVHGIDPATPIGTCFRTPASGGSAAANSTIDLTETACTKAHTYELLAIKQAADSATYPDVAYWQGAVAESCRQAYTAYTGAAAVTATSSAFFKPTRIGWNEGGDRTIYCVAYSAVAVSASARDTTH
jgi:hypothetical protein